MIKDGDLTFGSLFQIFDFCGYVASTADFNALERADVLADACRKAQNTACSRARLSRFNVLRRCGGEEAATQMTEVSVQEP